MGALPAKQHQFVEYAEKDKKFRDIADEIDKNSGNIKYTDNLFAPEFDATKSYSTGAYAWHNDKLYKKLRNVGTGAPHPWIDEEWELADGTYIIDLIKQANQNLTNYENLIAEYRPSGIQYNIGDLCTHEGSLYRCIQTKASYMTVQFSTDYWEYVGNTNIYDKLRSYCYKYGHFIKLTSDNLNPAVFHLYSNGSADFTVATLSSMLYGKLSGYNDGNHTWNFLVAEHVDGGTESNTTDAFPGLLSVSDGNKLVQEYYVMSIGYQSVYLTKYSFEFTFDFTNGTITRSVTKTQGVNVVLTDDKYYMGALSS